MHKEHYKLLRFLTVKFDYLNNLLAEKGKKGRQLHYNKHHTLNSLLLELHYYLQVSVPLLKSPWENPYDLKRKKF